MYCQFVIGDWDHVLYIEHAYLFFWGGVVLDLLVWTCFVCIDSSWGVVVLVRLGWGQWSLLARKENICVFISRPFAWKMMFQTIRFENRVFVVGGGLKDDRMGVVCTDVFVT